MTQFAAGDPVLTVVLMVVTVTAGLIRAWIGHRTSVRAEEEQTRRIRIAVAGSTSTHRAAVVHECAALAAASRPAPRPRRFRGP
ncbi:hypothetical protein [Streptomyces sp. NPDC001770]